VTTASEARRRRAKAAAKYRPETIELLLIAEAPPAALDRYFYFEHVSSHDSLFGYVVRAVIGVEPSRPDKPIHLRRLRDRGVFLIDLKPEPKETGDGLEEYVPGLIARATALHPQNAITIKANVCDLVQQPLRDAGLNVVDWRIPFPSTGQQCRFLEQMNAALDSIGWRRLRAPTSPSRAGSVPTSYGNEGCARTRYE